MEQSGLFLMFANFKNAMNDIVVKLHVTQS